MITRHIISLIKHSLERFPAVLFIGARQVGKSTLAELLPAIHQAIFYGGFPSIALVKEAYFNNRWFSS